MECQLRLGLIGTIMSMLAHIATLAKPGMLRLATNATRRIAVRMLNMLRRMERRSQATLHKLWPAMVLAPYARFTRKPSPGTASLSMSTAAS